MASQDNLRDISLEILDDDIEEFTKLEAIFNSQDTTKEIKTNVYALKKKFSKFQLSYASHVRMCRQDAEAKVLEIDFLMARQQDLKNDVRAALMCLQELEDVNTKLQMTMSMGTKSLWNELETLNKLQNTTKIELAIKSKMLSDYHIYSANILDRNTYLEDKCTSLLEQLENADKKQECSWQILEYTTTDQIMTLMNAAQSTSTDGNDEENANQRKLQMQIIELNATVAEKEREFNNLKERFQKILLEKIYLHHDIRTTQDERSILQLEINVTQENLLLTSSKLKRTEEELLEANKMLIQIGRNKSLNFEKIQEESCKLRTENENLLTKINNLTKSRQFLENYYEDKIKATMSAIEGVDHPILDKLVTSHNKSKSETDLTSKCFANDKDTAMPSSLTNIEHRSLFEKSLVPTLTQENKSGTGNKISYKYDDTESELTQQQQSAQSDIAEEKSKASMVRKDESEATTSTGSNVELELLNQKLNRIEEELRDSKKEVNVLLHEKAKFVKILQTSFCKENAQCQIILLNNEIQTLQSKISGFEEQANTAKDNYEREKVNSQVVQSDLGKEQQCLEENLHDSLSEQNTLLETITECNRKLKIYESSSKRYTLKIKSLEDENKSLAAEKLLLQTTLQTTEDNLLIEKSAHLKCLESVESDRRRLFHQLTLENTVLDSENKVLRAEIKGQKEVIDKEAAMVEKYKKELTWQQDVINDQGIRIKTLKAECTDKGELQSELEYVECDTQIYLERINGLNRSLNEAENTVREYQAENSNIKSKLHDAEAKLIETLSDQNRMKDLVEEMKKKIEDCKCPIIGSVQRLQYTQYTVVQTTSSISDEAEPHLADAQSTRRTNFVNIVKETRESMTTEQIGTNLSELLANLQLKENELAHAKEQIEELDTQYTVVFKELQTMRSQSKPRECAKCVNLTNRICELESHIDDMAANGITDDTLASYRNHCDYLTKKIDLLEKEKQKLHAHPSQVSEPQYTTDLENELLALKNNYKKLKTVARTRLIEIQELKSRLGYDPYDAPGRSTDP